MDIMDIVEVDVYVYLPNFKDKDISDFLERYLNTYIPNNGSLYYRYPQFGNSPTIFKTEVQTEMLQFVLSSIEREYIFYFQSTHKDQKAIVSVYPNRNVCLGLYFNNHYDEEKCIEEFKTYFKTDHIFSCYFVPPPSSLEELFKILGINQ